MYSPTFNPAVNRTPRDEAAGRRLPIRWAFITGGGYQNYYHRNQLLSAWAVRDGDVAAPIPEPETYAMMLAGLGLLGVAARRRKQAQA